MKRFWIFAIISGCIILAAPVESWTEVNGAPVSARHLIIQFDSDAAPELGFEAPLTLAELPDLQQTVTRAAGADLSPFFYSITEFTQRHRDFGLHQFYVLSFEEDVAVGEMADEIRQLPGIERVDFNRQGTPAYVPDDPSYPLQWGHDNTGQASHYNGGQVGTPDCDMDTDEAWDTTTGSSEIVVAVLDTGVNPHVELEGRILEGYNSVNNNNQTNDAYGHGTQCSGIVAAAGDNGTGVAGIAWDSMILPVKVLSNSGSGDQVQLANGITWAADNGANVISMSLQYGSSAGDFVAACNNAINYATSLNVAVLAATGNFASNPVTFPAQYENCIGVASLSPCNELKSYNSCDGENYWGANFGEDLEFLTPGVRIHTITNTGGYTDTFNGTSSACPAGAGVAALILSVTPTLTFPELREIMHQSCDDLYGPGFDIQSGWGRLNANTAVQLAWEANCGNLATPGDVNDDGEINVLDIVMITNIILNIFTDPDICQEWAADFDGNELINVLDIIQMLNLIVDGEVN